MTRLETQRAGGTVAGAATRMQVVLVIYPLFFIRTTQSVPAGA